MTQHSSEVSPDSAAASPKILLGIGDALHRFAAGQDLRDQSLLESAFTEDAELDFSGAAFRRQSCAIQGT